MKKYIGYLLLILILQSCFEKKKDKIKIVGKPEIEKQYDRAKLNLLSENEKIILLCKSKNINYDTTFDILLDYTAITYKYLYKRDSSRFYIEKAFDHISTKHKISQRQIAKLIFIYKYELLTQEEIGNDAIDSYFEEQEQW